MVVKFIKYNALFYDWVEYVHGYNQNTFPFRIKEDMEQALSNYTLAQTKYKHLVFPKALSWTLKLASRLDLNIMCHNTENWNDDWSLVHQFSEHHYGRTHVWR